MTKSGLLQSLLREVNHQGVEVFARPTDGNSNHRIQSFVGESGSLLIRTDGGIFTPQEILDLRFEAAWE